MGTIEVLKEAQAVEPATGERAELIARLRVLAKSATIPILNRAADMLEADAVLAHKRVAAIAADREYWRERAQQVAVP